MYYAQGRFRCIAKNAAGQAISECTLTVKSAAKPAAEQAVVPTEQVPKEVTHTIQMEDVQRDTLEVEEQKTLTDREVTLFYDFVHQRAAAKSEENWR